MAKSTKHIILLRSEPTAAQTDYTRPFISAGFSPSYVPALAKHPSPSPRSSNNSLSELPSPQLHDLLTTRIDSFSSLIITSARGITALSDALTSCDDVELAARWRTLPLWVVGPATASAARQSGFETVLGSEAGSAAELGDRIVSTFNTAPTDSRPMLFLAGDKARVDLPTRLERGGISLEQVTVYVTLANPTLEADLSACLSAIDVETGAGLWFAFFSPSGVDAALEAVKHATEGKGFNVKLASIGPTTSGRLREVAEVVSAEATRPAPDALVHAILDASTS
ncbi:hypothetical protein HKX48_006997 [Thoreauomyces humboldtii]|nr:hypothetical protein HKX48_006997 [Thoreauomyces humboldtii]